MNSLSKVLADIIRKKVLDNLSNSGSSRESRFIFHGPPLEFLEEVFIDLVDSGGIHTSPTAGEVTALPILLQVPRNLIQGRNPKIGASGRCDENQLLNIRNDPNGASYVALLPPGQHSNMSVATTTEEFGVSAANNTGHATFDEWWSDGFIQALIKEGLRKIGIDEDSMDDATALVHRSAAALHEIDSEKGTRAAAWRLLSRVFSIQGSRLGLQPGVALALVCGVPPMTSGEVSAKVQLDTLKGIASELADGFKAGIDNLASGASYELKLALQEFLKHIRLNCKIPTAFERATLAFYLPSQSDEIEEPPQWWTLLTVESWAELMSEQPDETGGDLQISCVNSIFSGGPGIPALVRNEVVLSVSADSASDGAPVEVNLAGGTFGKPGQPLSISGSRQIKDTPSASQKSPTNYKVSSPGRKPSTEKVVSLENWAPGIFVACRLARKITAPKKPRKGSSSFDWETTLTLPGSGRYELLLFTSSGVKISGAVGLSDDATEQIAEDQQTLEVRALRGGEFQIEIEADGKYQVDISFLQPGQRVARICKVYVVCEEAKEEGCNSEFERLIKLNRRHLEKFDAKAVVQLDRHARLSSLQSWILDEANISQSFVPVVISDDYASCWSSPDWTGIDGPILSEARFLHDPRPKSHLFHAPKAFLEARIKIAAKVRETSDYAGLVESAPLGQWLARDPEFGALVEAYLDAYLSWLNTAPETACWVDAIAVCTRDAAGRTLARVPEAIILSPIHPLRFAWHCFAQQAMYSSVSEVGSRPCPAASILDPDCVPDLLTMFLQSPGGDSGIERVNFLSVESSSDYWAVLWNGALLGQIPQRARQSPFDSELGLVVGGIASGFSPAQVGRALEDVTDLLAAKPTISVVVSSAGGATDACNDGLANWCTQRFGNGEKAGPKQGVGPKYLEVYDTRPLGSRPDQATISNLSEDTGNLVRWFDRLPSRSNPDLGIIAQLDSSQPECKEVGTRSALSIGGLVRHRVRRQLHGSFLSESRQSQTTTPTGEVFADKITACLVALEGISQSGVGLQFAPNVHAISDMIEQKRAGFVAVSSSAIDPACFLGGWVKGTYLWDYDLPSYSHRAGDTNGYYLLSQIRDADRDAFGRALADLPGCSGLTDAQTEKILLEVARRGIPTVRGLSGDDTGATGDLGLFIAARLLQDQFRVDGNFESILPIISGTPDNATLSIIIPVDPFRGYLADLARSVGTDKKGHTLSRPDLLVVSILLDERGVRFHLTPIEVKCRQLTTKFSAKDAVEALAQAKAMSSLLASIFERAENSTLWGLAYKHLLLSMIGFGLRVYSIQEGVQAGLWAKYHERIATALLGPDVDMTIDRRGRLIVIDGSKSDAQDHDNDGFEECIFVSPQDAGRVVAGAANEFYDAVRKKVGSWDLLPPNRLTKRAESDVGLEGTDEISTQLPDSNPSKDAGTSKEDVDKETALVGGSDEVGRGVELKVGTTVNGFETRSLALNISDTRLNQLNIGVVGDLGTGKTQLLKSLIYQIASSAKENRGVKPRFLIFDYKRDYSSADFVEATGAKVVRPVRLPLNLFDTSTIGESVAPWLDRFRFFADVLDKVYSGIGPVQRDKLKGAVRSAYEESDGAIGPPTIYDIHAQYRELLGGKSDAPMAIIDDLVDMEVFERDAKKTKSFDEFLDGVVVISLDALGQDDRSKNLLVAIMLNMFYENMLRTPKRPFLGSDPQLRVIDSYLLVDEADNIMRYEFDVLRKLLLQGREFGTGVILASQYLRHFKTSGTDYREPLLTWFLHKVPSINAAELSGLGLISELSDLSEQVKVLANHHCLYKSFDCPGEVIRGLPFYELKKGN